MRVVDNRGLRLRVRDPQRITTAIPTSRDLGNNEVLVKWGVDEARVLRNLNVKNVPSPILGQYDWPGRYKPFEHQKTTSSFLTLNSKAFCFNEQGTGKTASAIWAADFLLKQGVINKVLIICPLSIMDSAWRADLFTFAMHRSVDIAHGPKDKRRQIVMGDSDFVIINYDGVEIVEEHIQMAGYDLIIVDEATHYKNANSKRWKVLNRIIKPETWVWMMTGTPAAQSPLDAFGLAKMINPLAVPRSFSSFREMVMYKVTQFKWVPKDNAVNKVHAALQPAIRYTKEQCLDLPEMTYAKREVELTPQQNKYYKAIRSHMLTMAAGEQVTAPNAAVTMNKLLQISCGAVYADSGETVEFDIKNRYKVLKEVIDEASQKVLIFVPFKHVIDILSEKLFKDKISNGIIRGDVCFKTHSTVQRIPRHRRSQSPDNTAASRSTWCHLTAANTIVWWGPVASLETYAQANARVHRSGQRHPCTVVQLQGSPVEKRVYKLLDQRIDVHTKIIDLYNEVLEM